ncbi:TetR/AcrR family transcriptional regulator [Streptomyces sp. NPDC090054]|uniref:TetR/AcrR family transcriptional regulator n=1 Tax=Streptomyces sp. NPDC090054 TaxID=3365933 RepID=UPI0037F35B97
MTETAATTTPRERYRRQVRAEIKERAREQIASAGTTALSLNKIAKIMGLSGAGLYRYFTSRDALLTELVRDAYQSLADTFRTVAEGGEGDLRGLARALRAWALADPQRYFLVYGPPVPGYRGPADPTSTMSDIMSCIRGACDAQARKDHSGPACTPPARAGEDLQLGSAQRRAVAFWTRLHGVLSLELSGHFAGMDIDPCLLYEAELDLLATG